MKVLIPLLLLSATVIGAKAQVRQNVYYIAKDGREVEHKDSAETIRIVREPDSGSHNYVVLEFYAKSSKRKMTGTTSKIEPIRLEGQCITYYENGLRKSVAEYMHNMVKGTEYTFYPNGKPYTEKAFSEPDTTGAYDGQKKQDVSIISCLDSTGKALVTEGNGHYIGYQDGFKLIYEQGEVKNGKQEGEWKGHEKNDNIDFTETYQNGKLITGHAKNEDGEYTYNSRYIQPQYVGGINAFYKYIARFITYPIPERMNNIEGLVMLSFVVTKTGTIKDIKVLQSVSPNIDREAIRALRLSKGWLPGVAYGRQSDFVYTIPIIFQLKG